MKIRILLCGTIMMLHSAASAQPSPRNNVPILVYWSSGQGEVAPSAVEFEDQRQGVIPFSRAGDHFKGMRSAHGSWVFHDVSLLYGAQGVPLALRTRADVPSVRIDVALPATTSCKPALVSSLKNVSEKALIRTRVKSMIAARHLLELRSNVCPSWAKRDLAEIYFTMNCSLAKGTSFFRVSDEAKQRYRQFARNTVTAEERIKACDAQMFGVAAASLREAANAALAVGDFERFASLNKDLRASAVDPEWKRGLAVQGLDDTTLKADWLLGLYKEQQLAKADGEIPRALQVNAMLANLRALPQFNEAFVEISLTGAQLEGDRRYLESKLTAVTPDR